MASTRDEYAESEGEIYLGSICNQLWSNPQINWDGLLLGCCRNFWGDFGANVFSDGLKKAVNNEKIVYARDMLQGKRPARDDIPCTTCEMYLYMQDKNAYIIRRSGLLSRVEAVLNRYPRLNNAVHQVYRGLGFKKLLMGWVKRI